MESERIYIAGPFLPTILPKISNPKLLIHATYPIIYHNVENAIRAGVECLKKGHNPYIPHLTYFTQMYLDKDLGERWYDIDMDWLRCCNSILMIGDWKRSKGATNELEEAKKLNFKVYYNISEIKKVR